MQKIKKIAIVCQITHLFRKIRINGFTDIYEAYFST